MDSSSEGSTDEEEVLRLFDKEAKVIVQSETLPKKSADRYMQNYNAYKNWKEKNKNSLSTSEENNLIVYFKDLKKRLSPLTLWSVWSMLKKTLNTNDDIQINNFLNLKSMIKRNAKGHRPKKSFILTWEQIKKFIDEAPDSEYLAVKVVLIFGICGCLRCLELTNMKVGDVEDLNGRYLISINDNKNDYPGQFIIGNLFYAKVKTYISKRPSGNFNDRFFIQYTKDRCTRTPIGRHTIGGMPKKIATYLDLPNINRHTGHCFRRSSATLLSNSGANMQMIKQLGRWRSDVIAQGYV
ncbi:uncharacterized protein LOC123261158 [Cotesia glomerata]|uniref:uncharacterized protein LOC123261158 n=1 Tax=Cotesia glomerata TaxID=32391 RepID=UPI001D00962B|nr:uncharacterized protein LOC123261158 [Cotesia glomerata]